MMKELKTTILAFLLLVSLPAFSQDELPIVDPMLIRLKARLVSAADSTPVPYATVLNNRTHSGTTTNADGYFSLEMLNIDSLIVSSVGYEKSVLKIPYNYSGQNTLLFRMLPVAYAVGQVDVQGCGSEQADQRQHYRREPKFRQQDQGQQLNGVQSRGR